MFAVGFAHFFENYYELYIKLANFSILAANKRKQKNYNCLPELLSLFSMVTRLHSLLLLNDSVPGPIITDKCELLFLDIWEHTF